MDNTNNEQFFYIMSSIRGTKGKTQKASAAFLKVTVLVLSLMYAYDFENGVAFALHYIEPLKFHEQRILYILN